MIALAIAPAFGGVASCEVRVDGAPQALLDCLASGQWRLSCDVPATGPKVRVRVRAPLLGLTAEAVVPWMQGTTFELPLTTAFTDHGKVAGPTQWCPAEAPGPAGERTAVDATFEVVSYQQTGFAEETLEGGVVNRVPTFDAGAVVATTTVAILQRPGTGSGGAAAPDRPVTGKLQLRAPDGSWVPLVVSGARSDVKVTPGAVRLLVIDLPITQLEALSPGDPTRYVRDDLVAWFGGDPSSMLGMVAWSKADLPPPVPLAFDKGRASTDHAEVRVTKGATKVRVVVGWREQGVDAAARKVVDDAAAGAP